MKTNHFAVSWCAIPHGKSIPIFGTAYIELGYKTKLLSLREIQPALRQAAMDADASNATLIAISPLEPKAF